MKPGVWICPKPKRVLRSHDELRDRRELAKEFWLARKKIGLLEAGDRCHFYEDDGSEEMEEPVVIEDLAKYDSLNTHLGKAGGLNFALQASVYTMFEQGLPAPAPTRPFFFAIVDARHSVDERMWLNVLPCFFSADERAAVSFNPSVCLCQLAHSYLGMKHKTDVLDMANDFLFTGMAVIRNQSYGMTSCGTGGIWSITSARQLGEFFYGRTMIEDSASSLEHFLKGRKAVYVAPYAGKKPEQQLMCAVPKVSANYLEALERWDTGAVQCLCAQGLGRPWFWVTLSCMLVLITAMLLPALLPTQDLQDLTSLAVFAEYLSNPAEHPFIYVLVGAVVLWTVFIVTALVFSLFFTSALNYTMRILVLFFNVTYPFNSVSSIFWIMIPPWICLAGKFPFRFQPVVAIAGSLALRLVEWMIVMKTKKESERNGTHLYEYSIFRSQQMNEVTVPIKLRAVMKGLATGYADVVGKKDNSFWVSFGTAQAVQWVQAWLASCMLAMIAGLVGGVVNLCMHLTTRRWSRRAPSAWCSRSSRSGSFGSPPSTCSRGAPSSSRSATPRCSCCSPSASSSSSPRRPTRPSRSSPSDERIEARRRRRRGRRRRRSGRRQSRRRRRRRDMRRPPAAAEGVAARPRGTQHEQQATERLWIGPGNKGGACGGVRQHRVHGTNVGRRRCC